jgi:hypothetical protein
MMIMAVRFQAPAVNERSSCECESDGYVIAIDNMSVLYHGNRLRLREDVVCSFGRTRWLNDILEKSHISHDIQQAMLYTKY